MQSESLVQFVGRVRESRSSWSVLGALLFALQLTPVASAQGWTKVISRSSTGEIANDAVFEPSLSADGRYLSFHALATNLVTDDTNGFIDVFVHDAWTGKTIRASVDSSGVQGDNHSEFSSISADGRYVAFESQSTNLIAGPTVVSNGIYVHDNLSGQTSCVSLSPAGQHADSECHAASISGDGRYVAFVSLASNLVAGDLNTDFDIFVHDRTTGLTVRASVDSAGLESDGSSGAPTLSADGRFVVFNSTATNLVAGDTNGVQDIFVRDLQLGLTERVSVDSLGVQGDASSGESFGPTVTSSLSADGRYAAFNSRADNLVSGDTNGVMDVFVHDRTTGATNRVSVDSTGAQSNDDSIDPHLSADGHEVFFSSLASNLVTSDVNGAQDVFSHEMGTGVTALVSLATNGSPSTGDSWEPSPSADGRWVAFHSYGAGLVPEPANGLQAYLRDRTGSSPTIARYCTPGKSTNGCLATLSAAGLPSATAGSGFTITVHSIEGQSMGLIYYGVAGPDDTPFGGGGSVFCVRHPFQRTGLRSTGGTIGSCNGQLSVDWNRFITLHGSAVGSPFTGGETVWIQAWFRDPRAPGASNLSDALWFDVGP